MKLNHNKSNRMLVFVERGKPEYPGKNLSEQSIETTNSNHIGRRVRKSNPGHIDGGRMLSPLRQPCSLYCKESKAFSYRFVSSFVKLSSQEKGAHIIIGTFPHSRAREVFCEVMHFISVVSLTWKSKFRPLKELSFCESKFLTALPIYVLQLLLGVS